MTATSLALHHHLRSALILALAVSVVWLICEVAMAVENARDRRDFDDSFLRMCRAIEREEARK